MDKAEIFEWLKSQKYQTTYDEVGEYTTYYGVDMPKILEDYYEYKVKKLNESAVSGSAYIAKLNDGEEICVIAKNIAEAFGIMTKSLCDAIKSTKQEKRYVMYQDQKCELLGTTDGSITLNTGGLAFCIIFPDGSIKNVQDTQCRFL